jgi:uncharacterized integral membrane protein
LITLRRLAFIAALVVLILLAAVFAYTNPEPIDVDVGLMRFERVSMTVVFVVVFALGWLFGLFSAGLALWRSTREKRRLRQDLAYAEAELRTLRKAP